MNCEHKFCIEICTCTYNVIRNVTVSVGMLIITFCFCTAAPPFAIDNTLLLPARLCSLVSVHVCSFCDLYCIDPETLSIVRR